MTGMKIEHTRRSVNGKFWILNISAIDEKIRHRDVTHFSMNG